MSLPFPHSSFQATAENNGVLRGDILMAQCPRSCLFPLSFSIRNSYPVHSTFKFRCCNYKSQVEMAAASTTAYPGGITIEGCPLVSIHSPLITPCSTNYLDYPLTSMIFCYRIDHFYYPLLNFIFTLLFPHHYHLANTADRPPNHQETYNSYLSACSVTNSPPCQTATPEASWDAACCSSQYSFALSVASCLSKTPSCLDTSGMCCQVNCLFDEHPFK